ncbi:uncharacterized protein LOC124402558 isoform X3 [Silurus meridionalis]|uniref:uncharacterized protein LOC124402558 isoform X3 n=1 Tax=Silurus meridionalis TaxID=175797 RepID=UPI001EE9EA93|nr:uncharacterized protein LOC124402558 isoform X3 [Silurus meridionalis]
MMEAAAPEAEAPGEAPEAEAPGEAPEAEAPGEAPEAEALGEVPEAEAPGEYADDFLVSEDLCEQSSLCLLHHLARKGFKKQSLMTSP